MTTKKEIFLNSNAVPKSPGIHLKEITGGPGDLGSIGADLKAARVAREEELRPIADSLKIRIGLLEALEGGDLNSLPGRAYALGFVRSYAEYLGIDSDEAADRFKDECDSIEDDEELTFPDMDMEAGLPKGSLIIASLVLLAIIYAGWLFSVSANRIVSERVPPVPERLVPEPSEDVAAIDKVIEATERPSESVAAAVSEEPVTQEGRASSILVGDPADAAVAPSISVMSTPVPAVQAQEKGTIGDGVPTRSEEGYAPVMVRALREVWIQVEDDRGAVLVSQTLRPGQSYRAPERDDLVLLARNAGAIELYLDGQSIGPAGEPGQTLVGEALNPEALRARASQ